MTLIRGLNGLYPCPVCLVPKEQLSDTSKTWPRRNARDHQRILTQKFSAAVEEEALKALSLRPVTV